ncbi:PKD domain-containing protein [Rosettibacter firmus]|uniref:PKD domain-containing protein n=1 Tax=Rosettibacter firmus TaxID=3111522 RepID=UPI00336BF0E8
MKKLLACIFVFLFSFSGFYLDREDVTFPVFQFPHDRIPVIDGNPDDWAIVPESYTIGIEQAWEDSGKQDSINKKNLDFKVKVGWVKGLNRLYFLYEAYDDFWNFCRNDHHNDIFEVVVDGDLSGGPLVDHAHYKVWTPEAVGTDRVKLDPRITPEDEHWLIHGVHAQNYHIFTPPGKKDWCMVWGIQPWIKEFPYALSACKYNFTRTGQSGKLILEFYITVFDYAPADGPARAVESKFEENKLIGLSWAVIDYDDSTSTSHNGFWNLSRHHTMYGNASYLCLFKLMPLLPEFLPKLKANWSFKVIDFEKRIVAFKDLSIGNIKKWKWDFGDGNYSYEQNPVYQYKKGGDYNVTLYIEGPDGKDQLTKVWDVSFK